MIDCWWNQWGICLLIIIHLLCMLLLDNKHAYSFRPKNFSGSKERQRGAELWRTTLTDVYLVCNNHKRCVSTWMELNHRSGHTHFWYKIFVVIDYNHEGFLWKRQTETTKSTRPVPIDSPNLPSLWALVHSSCCSCCPAVHSWNCWKSHLHLV